jgi:hypothetical protein
MSLLLLLAPRTSGAAPVGDIAAKLQPVSTFAPAASVRTFAPATTVRTFNA